MYAVMVKEYTRNGSQWLTHKLCETSSEAYAEYNALVYETKQFSSFNVCVRGYHTREWEHLVAR